MPCRIVLILQERSRFCWYGQYNEVNRLGSDECTSRGKGQQRKGLAELEWEYKRLGYVCISVLLEDKCGRCAVGFLSCYAAKGDPNYDFLLSPRRRRNSLYILSSQFVILSSSWCGSVTSSARERPRRRRRLSSSQLWRSGCRSMRPARSKWLGTRRYQISTSSCLVMEAIVNRLDRLA